MLLHPIESILAWLEPGGGVSGNTARIYESGGGVHVLRIEDGVGVFHGHVSGLHFLADSSSSASSS